MSSESTNAANSSSFTKAFLVGLIVGIVVGGFAGAFLPPLLEGYRLPTPRESGTKGGAPPPKVTTHDENREPAKPEPTDNPAPTGEQPKPEEPKPGDKPNG